MLVDKGFIGRNIKEKRKLIGMTQKELAMKILRTESSIRKYEKGLVEIPINIIEEIAKVLGTTPFKLIGSYFSDAEFPDIQKSSDEFEAFKSYLRLLGYMVDDLYKTCRTPLELVPDKFKVDIVDGEDSVLGEIHDFVITKGKKSVRFSEDEFDGIMTVVKDVIEFKFYKKYRD
jgi:transcriptional regulator with XRE-family HTH domain